MLPSHNTKHLPLLRFPFVDSTFYLAQRDDGICNGTALWLSGQCLALYFAEYHVPTYPPRPRAIELGSGVGLTALALASLGWDVLATDIDLVISSVLSNNIQTNLAQLPERSGRVEIHELDWLVSPAEWKWDITSGSNPPYDLIYSADTVYKSELVEPLLRTIHALSTLSRFSSSPPRSPLVLLCVERRDPPLLDRLLDDARNIWNFSVERIPRKRLSKALNKHGAQWDNADWEGIELWKLRLK
ncbi:uncharacterized protein LACBIDRAFT_305911 [Laccaria bicolor S238N-H82]|uniref:Predicted protein n=1 Tax=Laccaria bicolor (strain S238N-H82 / ATCC MYA-4686) TaxID=486041 RepID=B0CS81_LACBS|nr:uncharacterized protein LACBIDRAFT_305911 [Laccaria bicolor S238N-H82]EDR14800.1 predicted protein [Laccaria bicolor S238N-H82]|eukprot:XP_001875359.1 predicted protein [Laccaria bicolor S238N-H82]